MYSQQPTHPPHPPQHQPPNNRRTPPQRPEGESEMNSPITDRDRKLLTKLLNNPQEAQQIYNLLQNSPPEIATLGYLVMRVYEQTQNTLGKV